MVCIYLHDILGKSKLQGGMTHQGWQKLRQEEALTMKGLHERNVECEELVLCLNCADGYLSELIDLHINIRNCTLYKFKIQSLKSCPRNNVIRHYLGISQEFILSYFKLCVQAFLVHRQQIPYIGSTFDVIKIYHLFSLCFVS